MSEHFKTFHEEALAIGTMDNLYRQATNLAAIVGFGFGNFHITPDLTAAEFKKRLQGLDTSTNNPAYESITAFVVIKWLVFHGAANLDPPPNIKLSLEWSQTNERNQLHAGVFKTDLGENSLKYASIVWGDGMFQHRLRLEEFKRIADLLPDYPVMDF